MIAAAGAEPAERMRVAGAFLSFYEQDTLLHFHEEEEVLFPALIEHVDEVPAELTQVLVEHVRIHGLVGRLRHASEAGAPDGALLGELGETLRSHVRLEENELFPLIERVVPASDLGRVTFAPRQRS